MNNPFEVLEERLSNIENLILNLKQSQDTESKVQTEQLLTAQEAAKFLNLSLATIYSKVSRNELPVMKRSKRLYFSSTELLIYLKAGRKKSNSEIEAEAEAFLLNTKKGMK
jgi:excisionase family DNA binding protein